MPEYKIRITVQEEHIVYATADTPEEALALADVGDIDIMMQCNRPLDSRVVECEVIGIQTDDEYE